MGRCMVDESDRGRTHRHPKKNAIPFQYQEAEPAHPPEPAAAPTTSVAAPMPLDMSGEEAYLRRAQMGAGQQAFQSPPQTTYSRWFRLVSECWLLRGLYA